MVKRELIVKDIINNLHAYDPLAYKLFDRIHLEIKSIDKPTIIILDFSGLITLTYEFIEKALKGIIGERAKLKELMVLYKIENHSELEEIITGLVDFLELQKVNEKYLDERELLSLNFSMVYLDAKDNINYIGKLSNIEEYILKIIEDRGSSTHSDIDEALKSKEKSSYCEEIASTVSKLNDLGFIHIISKGEGIPSSIYQSIKYLIHNGN